MLARQARGPEFDAQSRDVVFSICKLSIGKAGAGRGGRKAEASKSLELTDHAAEETRKSQVPLKECLRKPK